MMIRYPILRQGAAIGVMSPSSGVDAELHHLLLLSRERMESKGYAVTFGETVWTQNKAKSSAAKIRAAEFQAMMGDGEIDMIFPPWGGELAIEILKHIDFDQLPSKWVLGYSDTSVLLLAITLQKGIATAHGVNFVDCS